jgi:predicted metal-dependent phosphoesterase TrpH
VTVRRTTVMGDARGTGGADAEGPVDLHLHSNASDGTLPPGAVIHRAASLGLSGVSLTDHDTVEGLSEAAREAAQHGLAFLPGAELSANEPGRSVHVLAYGFDLDDADMLKFLAAYRRDRVRRAREIAERFRALGVPLEYEEVEREAGRAAPTRAHIARALVRCGLINGQEEVFRRYLSRGRPAFVEKRPTPPAEVFERVHAAGGVAVLAHPGREHGAREIRRWASEGLDGVEVRHPSNSPDVRQRLASLARELDLLCTGGSDWHGPGTHRADLGSERVPRSWLDTLAARCGVELNGGPTREP